MVPGKKQRFDEEKAATQNAAKENAKWQSPDWIHWPKIQASKELAMRSVLTGIEFLLHTRPVKGVWVEVLSL